MGFKEKAAYALGAVGKDMAYMLASGYVLYYYQDVLGVDAWIMGIILLAARILDAFNAPVMGVVVARTHTKWGRFRPWMLTGTLSSACLLYLMYACPGDLSGRGLAAYAAIVYILWGVVYTMMDIPFWSMLPAFTRVGRERERTTSLSRTAASLGAAFINVLTVKAVRWLGYGADVIGFRRFALFVSATFVIAIVLTCLFIKEKPVKAEQTTGIGEMFRTLVRNDQTMYIVLVCVLVNGAMFITTNLLIYYFKYDFGDRSWYNSFTACTGVGNAIQLLSMMFILPVIRRKLAGEKAFRTGIIMAVTALAILLMLMVTRLRWLPAMFVPAALMYTAFGILSVMLTVSLANTVEYGRWRYGRSDESVIFSMQAFVIKLTSGMAALTVSLVLTAAHIRGGAAEGDAAVEIPDASLMVLRIAMTVIPAALMLAGLTVHKKKFILTDAKMKEIMEADGASEMSDQEETV